jgi:hypothetical protein
MTELLSLTVEELAAFVKELGPARLPRQAAS